MQRCRPRISRGNHHSAGLGRRRRGRMARRPGALCVHTAPLRLRRRGARENPCREGRGGRLSAFGVRRSGARSQGNDQASPQKERPMMRKKRIEGALPFDAITRQSAKSRRAQRRSEALVPARSAAGGRRRTTRRAPCVSSNWSTTRLPCRRRRPIRDRRSANARAWCRSSHGWRHGTLRWRGRAAPGARRHPAHVGAGLLDAGAVPPPPPFSAPFAGGGTLALRRMAAGSS